MENEKEDSLDLSKEVPSKKIWYPAKETWHPERARMRLAYLVLIGIFSLFLFSIVVGGFAKIGYIDQETSHSMFELCRTGLLPIVTLILGYYFSKSN